MKSLRLWYWLGGLIAVGIVALIVGSRTSANDDAVRLGLLISWGLIGLGGELVSLLRSLRVELPPGAPPDARPADGEVGIVRLAGITSEPNARDPRFHRFTRLLEPTPGLKPALPAGRRCPPLLGRVVWVSVFVGRNGSAWSDDEIAQAHAAMLKAGVWLEREALRWGAAVNIDLAETYFVADDPARDDAVEVTLVTHGDRFAPADAHEATKLFGSVSRATASLGFRDLVDCLARVQPRFEADVPVWLIYLRSAGCSQVVTEHDTELGTIRLAVCYARESLFPEPLRHAPYIDPVTVVHEVLHLFDATDKYDVPLHAFPSKSVTSRDVMRLSETRLSRLRIDPRTASEIGWVTAAP